MNVWIVLAAIASTAITGLLTWLLYRLNTTTERNRGRGGLPRDPAITVGDGDGGADGGGD